MSPLLALFIRSLKEHVRSKSTYWARAGLIGIILMLMGMTHQSMGWAGAPGLQFFSQAVFINFFFIGLAGLSYFASAITEEKEDMTLGLLRLTNLNPLSILLGKSTSRLCGALLLLLAQFPFTLLAISMGGVSVGQIIAAYATLAAFIFFLSNLALLFSVVCRRTAGAAILTSASLVVFFFGPALTRAALSTLAHFEVINSAHPGPVLRWLLDSVEAASAFGQLLQILATGFSDRAFGFQVGSNLLLGLGCFLLAWSVFELFCSQETEAAPRRPSPAKGRRLFRIFAPTRAWSRALQWKDFYFIGGGKVAVLVKLAGYLMLLEYLIYWQTWFGNGRPTHWDEVGYFMMFCMTLAVTLELAVTASRIFRQECRWKTLSSLAMLPISMRRLAYQKVLGCLCAMWPAIFFFAVGVVCASSEIAEELESWSRSFSAGDWIVLGGIAFGVSITVFFLHLVAALSLRLKWGALPLSIGIVYIGGMFATGIAFLIFREAALVVLTVAMVIGAGVLHVNIGQRLEKLAAED